MAKKKTTFFCTECGVESSKWVGKCISCGTWGSVKEINITAKPNTRENFSPSVGGVLGVNVPVKISEIKQEQFTRINVGYEEVNRVLGGGIVPGSLILLGGEPGIGKSTLALQLTIKAEHLKTLYVSGEESSEQIKLRADRLGSSNEECYVLAETSLEQILQHAVDSEPDLIVIDSIQTLYTDTIESTAGGISQIRECAALLLRYAKQSGTPVFIIGHITKDGTIAGPKILEHIVDVVLQFEGDTNNIFRLLRGIKNRFGAANEIGVFEMRSEGLIEVENPSEILLSHYDEPLSGVAVGATTDGARSYLIETQALVGNAAYGTPQRTTTGFDAKRLSMLLAVIEKRLNFRMGTKDVFLNIAGGFRVNDPGLDISVVAAILSSALDKAISSDLCFAGEMGLSGEVRPAGRLEQRISEAKRLGFKRIVVSGYAKSSLKNRNYGIEILYVNKIEELARTVFN
ncbi:MAG: DNA repair protein RadA [Rikenellaceae bacterium]